MEERLRLGVLASGRGSNLQAIIDRCADGRLSAQVAVVISDVADAFALARARRAGVPAEFVDRRAFSSPEDFDRAILARLQARGVGLIVLAGYLRILTRVLVDPFAGRLLNIHPSLLPAFGGRGLHGLRVHQAVLDHGAKISGLTVHFVDLETDAGPILLQHPIEVEEDDTADSLADRVLACEHSKYSEAIQLFAEGRLRIEGRRVRVRPKAEPADET